MSRNIDNKFNKKTLCVYNNNAVEKDLRLNISKEMPHKQYKSFVVVFNIFIPLI